MRRRGQSLDLRDGLPPLPRSNPKRSLSPEAVAVLIHVARRAQTLEKAKVAISTTLANDPNAATASAREKHRWGSANQLISPGSLTSARDSEQAGLMLLAAPSLAHKNRVRCAPPGHGATTRFGVSRIAGAPSRTDPGQATCGKQVQVASRFAGLDLDSRQGRAASQACMPRNAMPARDGNRRGCIRFGSNAVMRRAFSR